MNIIKGMKQLYSVNLTTNKVHIMRNDNKYTLCGVDTDDSMILGFPEEGELKEVNCKRCLKIYNKIMEELI